MPKCIENCRLNDITESGVASLVEVKAIASELKRARIRLSKMMLNQENAASKESA